MQTLVPAQYSAKDLLNNIGTQMQNSTHNVLLIEWFNSKYMKYSKKNIGVQLTREMRKHSLATIIYEASKYYDESQEKT